MFASIFARSIAEKLQKSRLKKGQGQPSKQGHVQPMDDDNSTLAGRELEDTENELNFLGKTPCSRPYKN